jgi:hypothetical protein
VRWRTALALVVVALGVAMPAGRAASPSVTGLHLVHRWSPFVSSANLANTAVALDTRGRVVYSLSQTRGGPVQAQAWGLDSLSQLTPRAVVSTTALTTATPLAVDDSHHTLVIAEAPVAGSAAGLSVSTRVGGLLHVFGHPATRFPPGYSVVGMSVNPRRSLLYVLAEPSGCIQGICPVQTSGVGAGGIELDTLSLTDLAHGSVRSPWTAPQRLGQICGQVITYYSAAGMVISGDDKKAYLGCISNRGVVTLLGPNAGDIGGIAEVDLSAAGGGNMLPVQMHSVPGNFGTGDSIAVPGPARMVITAPTAGATSIKVFDTVHGYFVGSVGVDDNQLDAIGVDERSGQGYYLYRGGLTALDLAALPVPQGQDYSQLAPLLGTIIRRLAVDPATHRVFILNSQDQIQGTTPFVSVLRDDQPQTGDRATVPSLTGVDAPEAPGLTDSDRVGVAGAVGAEYRLVGGTANLIQNSVHFDSRGVVTRPGTRDLQFAIAHGVQLTNDQATAQTVTEAQDDATTSDTTVSAPAIPLQCIDFGSAPTSRTADSASASCDLGGQRVRTSAAASPGRILVNSPTVNAGNAVPDAVQVRSASTATEESRRGLGALAATVTSEADGISILGVVTIGRVAATVTTSAHGRSGSAAVSYARTISNVRVNGADVCGATCSLTTVVTAVNTALQGRAHIDFPAADQIATHDGRLAYLQDNQYHHVEQVLFNDVSADSVTSPAMSITVFSDGATGSREIVSLAALSAQTVYRIFPAGSVQAPPPVVTPGSVHPGLTEPGVLPRTLGKERLLAPGELTQAPSVQPPGSVGGFLSRALHLGFRSPGQILGIAVIWMLLALPAYLAARRRLLVELPLLTTEETP